MLALILLIILNISPPALGQSVLSLQHLDKEYAVAPKSTYHIDNSNQIEIFDLMNHKIQDWSSFKSSNPVLGFDNRIYWIQFKLQNISENKNWILHLKNPHYDFLEIFLTKDGKVYNHWKSGDMLPFSQRDILYSTFLFDLTLIKNEIYTVYIKSQTEGSLQFPIKLYTSSKMLSMSQDENLGLGLYFGIMVGMIVYNSFLLFSTRDRVFLFYLFFIASSTLMNLSLQGFIFKYFTPDFPRFSNMLISASLNLAALTLLIFSTNFLQSKTKLPRIHFMLNTFKLISTTALLCVPWMTYRLSITLGNLVGLSVAVILAVVAIYSTIQGHRQARFYLLAFIFFLPGVVVLALKDRGILPSTFVTNNAYLIGSAIEVLLFSLALGDKINQERKERYLIEKKEYQESQKKLHSYKQLGKILYPHQLASIKRDELLEHTMPTNKSTSVIIAFDIQDSSKLDSEIGSRFFESVLKKCYQLMNQNYEEDPLSNDAYMVKEMGDGFICSIGFPFNCKSSIYDKAVELSFGFVAIFRREAKFYFPDKNLYCSIGIATGTVSGRFPTIGLKNYDLYGDAIVKATRYEAFRKNMYKGGVKKNTIIIIQQEVARLLNHKYKSGLQSFNLDSFKVRDDPQAAELSYFLFEDEPIIESKSSA